MKHGMMRGVLLAALLLFSACASSSAERMTAGEAGAADTAYLFSEIPAAGEPLYGMGGMYDGDGEVSRGLLEELLPAPAEEATGGTQSSDVYYEEISAEESAEADIPASPPGGGATRYFPGEYTSNLADGAMLTVEEDGGFTFRMARRYLFVWEPTFSFDLSLRAYGMLEEDGTCFRLLLDDVTLACTSFSNASEAAKQMASNVMYTEYGLELNERLLSGQEISVDEFIGNDTLMLNSETEFHVTLNPEDGSFTLDTPILAGWLSS